MILVFLSFTPQAFGENKSDNILIYTNNDYSVSFTTSHDILANISISITIGEYISFWIFHQSDFEEAVYFGTLDSLAIIKGLVFSSNNYSVFMEEYSSMVLYFKNSESEAVGLTYEIETEITRREDIIRRNVVIITCVVAGVGVLAVIVSLLKRR